MAILAVQYPVFQYAMRIIDNITNDFPATVTTTFNHQYKTGLILRLNIPKGYGMQEANQLYAPIIVTGNTTFTIDLDTTYFSPYFPAFSFPFDKQSATVTPIGNINNSIYLAEYNALPYRGV